MPIAKIVKGTTALGCLNYVLGKTGSVLHQTNCVGSTPGEFAAQFDLALQAQAQRQSRGRKASTNVYHTSIAFDLECDLTVKEKLEIAGRYLEGMGFDRGQNAYVIAEHHDTQHQHLHLIVSRVRWDGYTTPCWQDYQRAEAIMRQVESDYGLKSVLSSRESEVKAPTVAEVRKYRSNGKPIPRLVIQQALDDCLERGVRSLSQLQQELREQHGVTLTAKPVETRSGGMTLALLFELEGRAYSASKLGKKYRYSRLKQGFGLDEQTVEPPGGVGEQAEIGVVEAQAGGPGGDSNWAEPVSSLGEAENSREAGGLSAGGSDLDEVEDHSGWQNWLETQTAANWYEASLTEPVPDRMQRDWALWTQFSRATEEWLARKGVPLAGEKDSYRNLSQVALYCRLSGYAPEQVARALLISPHAAQMQNDRLQSLNWQERDKGQFSVLKLMVKIDQQVMGLQEGRQNRVEKVRG